VVGAQWRAQIRQNNAGKIPSWTGRALVYFFYRILQKNCRVSPSFSERFEKMTCPFNLEGAFRFETQYCVFLFYIKKNSLENRQGRLLVICNKKNGVFWRSTRLLSHTQIVPLLRTHFVTPIHDLPLKLLQVSQVFLQQLASLHITQAG